MTCVLSAPAQARWRACFKRAAFRPLRVLSTWIVLLCVALGAMPSRAVLIDTGDGTGNTTPPPSDPGFANVGIVNGLTGVYVRNGWVLTANHVGEGAIQLGGVSYPVIAGSTVRFANPDATLADLIAFKLAVVPPLPDLAIASGPRVAGELLTIIGNGRDRGSQATWVVPGVGTLFGWNWLTTRSIRWGTNRVLDIEQLQLNTQAFSIRFDDVPAVLGQDEGDVVTGDSGGAAFATVGGFPELVGILYARASFTDQPVNTSFYGNLGLVSDLHAYRADVLAIIDQPDCSDGLDEDGDGLIDYPDDPGCADASDASELDPGIACDNGIDDDQDGLVDTADPGCNDPTDPDERGASYQCDNGVDDDGDFEIDFPDDPECAGPTGAFEAPEPGFGIGLALGGALVLSWRRRPQSTRSTR